MSVAPASRGVSVRKAWLLTAAARRPGLQNATATVPNHDRKLPPVRRAQTIARREAMRCNKHWAVRQRQRTDLPFSRKGDHVSARNANCPYSHGHGFWNCQLGG